ncbi:uncharacterized protein HaLaN_05206 [Haematococcus lacustris]|uniref:Uncharacterized protein n=1 Tax=Haematococcus lacustris TaxID=44745 RepID=A0A699YKG5_HAELA|nr:uncharacterized protein HaLaN_05206 [Haematococcus lacustris]
MSHPKYHLSQSQQYSDDAGWLKNEPQSWRHNLSKLTGSVDRNLRSLKQLENPRLLDIAGLQREALAHRMQADMLAQRVHGHPDTLSLQKSELGNLLAAVQGSLADLRVEVAAAKRLSTDASAAVHDASPPPKHLPNRAESVTRRHRYDRGPAAAAEALTAHSALDRSHSFAVGGLGSLLASPVQRNRRPPYSPSRRVALAYIADPAALPAAGAGHVTGEDLVRVLDSKMDELSERIEKQIGLSLTGQQQASSGSVLKAQVPCCNWHNTTVLAPLQVPYHNWHNTTALAPLHGISHTKHSCAMVRPALTPNHQ